MTREDFQTLIKTVTDFIGDRSLDESLQSELNEKFPADGSEFKSIEQACHDAIAAGWMCKHEQGGIKFGRVLKPDTDLQGFSVDVVHMNDIKGPHHRHPQGEIDMIMPIDADAKFDNRGKGWLVYGANSAHYPTVSEGAALVLYLLPNGEIEFS